MKGRENNMPKISIIVPVYNVENYLRKCLDSLMSQTVTDYEVICINDGSTDSSLEILREYEARYPRIRVISKENEGYGKTMNLGVEEARAPYIGIVESDDFVKPEMFEKLYCAITSYQADLVKCNFFRYRGKDGENIDYSHEYSDELYGQVIEPINYPKLYNAHSSIWAALYNKQFLNDNNIQFNETPGASFQDISFQFKILSSAKKMMIIQDALLYYRTDNLMSSIHAPDKIYCICDEMHVLDKYVEKQNNERQKILWPVLMWKKYFNYQWTLKHLEPVFKFAFYEKMVAELGEDKKAGRFDNLVWDSFNDKLEFEEMLDKPVEYFMRTIKEYHDSRIDMADTRNADLAELGFWSLLEEEKSIVIYGAGKVGQYVLERLKFFGIEPEKILLAATDVKTDEEVNGIPVKKIDELVKEKKDRLVLVAVKGEKQITMLNYLQCLECKNMVLVDDKILSYLGRKGKKI